MPTPYADAVARYAEDDRARVYVPGHAADPDAAPALTGWFGAELLRRDVPPLLAGIDKGPGNPLAESLALAARAWGARRTWFLTNGASQGNRIAALALGAYRDAAAPVVGQRSAHSSFIDGVILAGLSPRFVAPAIDPRLGINHGVSPAALRAALAGVESPKGVYLISPSYFGAVADVAALADIAHAAGAPLIVDAAWGAHFGFHPDLPENPLRLGADLVISSTHKLGGSLTQSAMLHLAGGPFADDLEPLVERAFMLTQSTSASALLLASLDLARETLETGHGRIAASIAAADRLRDEIRTRGRFGIVSDGFGDFDDIVDADPLRVSIDVARGGLHGHTVRDRLEREGVSFEISTDSCVVAVLGAGVVPDVDRIAGALHAIAPERAAGEASEPLVATGGPAAVGASTGAPEPAQVRDARPIVALPSPGPLAMLPREAFLAQGEPVPVAAAIGRVSTDALAAYPPGIPNVLPGEVITAEVVEFLQRIAATPGGYVRGAVDPTLATLRVVRGATGADATGHAVAASPADCALSLVS
ncbi:PLP-dependent transferase [Agromyces sp. H3Y2-19a]|jgi:arginine/lysine/ornithine decarboxylase|uniref:aminotransferase class I/II-fold pyridoxal phosphate-dependent enzyme n=1 Tax=Agromyces chromiiresistens TaxID=3030835 RepID=UPI0023BA2E53|nr:PLP-dependent transferase [Agromyces chromiiresistens]MDF0514224.1 PLP-dependent transferase [Agromyces chromiiresistens]